MDDMKLSTEPSVEMEDAPAEMKDAPAEKKPVIRMESVTFKIGDKLFTLSYDDFVGAGIQDSWVVRRLGRDEELLVAALNKLLNN